MGVITVAMNWKNSRDSNIIATTPKGVAELQWQIHQQKKVINTPRKS